MIERFYKRYRWILLVFISIVIIKIVYVVSIPGLTQITGPDEIGTIAGAVYFAGFDWSEIIKNQPYYGFGYSILFAPFFMLGLSSRTIYFIMLLSNALCLGLSGVICYSIAFRYLHAGSEKFCCLLAVVSAFFTNNNTATNYFINEAPLILLTWLVLYILLVMAERIKEDKKNYLLSFLLAFSMGYAFLVHTRGIFLWGAVVVFLFFHYITEKKRVLRLEVFLPVFITLFFLVKEFIDYLQRHLWMKDGNTLRNDINSIADLPGKIRFVLTKDGFKSLVRFIIANLYGMSLLTYGLMILLFVLCIYYLRRLYAVKSRTEVIGEIKENQNIFLCAVYILSLLIAIPLIVSLNYINTGVWNDNRVLTIEYLSYSRYWAVITPEVIMLVTVLLRRINLPKGLYAATLAGTLLISGLFIYINRAAIKASPHNEFTGYYDFFPLALIDRDRAYFKISEFIIISIVGAVITALVFLLFRKRKASLALLVLFVFFTYNNVYITYSIQRKDSVSRNDMAAYAVSFLNEIKLKYDDYNAIGIEAEQRDTYQLLFILYDYRLTSEKIIGGYRNGYQTTCSSDILISTNKSIGLRYKDYYLVGMPEESAFHIYIRASKEDLLRAVADAGYVTYIQSSCVLSAEDFYFSADGETGLQNNVSEITLVQSWIMKSPRIEMPAGRYRIAFYGENLSDCRLYCSSDTDTERYTAVEVESGENCIVYEVYLDKDVKASELVLINDGSYNARISYAECMYLYD